MRRLLKDRSVPSILSEPLPPPLLPPPPFSLSSSSSSFCFWGMCVFICILAGTHTLRFTCGGHKTTLASTSSCLLSCLRQGSLAVHGCVCQASWPTGVFGISSYLAEVQRMGFRYTLPYSASCVFWGSGTLPTLKVCTNQARFFLKFIYLHILSI